MFSGCLVALVTPFKDGEVDHAKLRELVDWHLEQGTDGLVPCGTTGESPTLSFEEHEEVIATVIKQAEGRVPVVAGTGSNNTTEALRLTRFAKDAGADGALKQLINFSHFIRTGVKGPEVQFQKRSRQS